MIGYYVHHHGAGHVHRFLALRECLPGLVGLGSGGRPAWLADDAWVELEDDAQSPTPRDPTASGALHWAPLRDPGLRARTARLARWVEESRPRALVVDVSVEIALAARLLSVPTVVIAQHGDRSDAPHELAYRSASAVAALWPEGAAPTPPAAVGRVHHVGPISRFDEAARAARDRGDATVACDGGRRRALLLLGRGGHDLPSALVARTIEATAGEWEWELLGPAPELGGRDATAGEVWEALGRSDVVVAPASNNCVAEVAAAGRPLIALPQARPFDEQHAHATSLEALGLATVLERWPEPERWGELLASAAGSEPDWAAYTDGHGADRLAAVVLRVAGGA